MARVVSIGFGSKRQMVEWLDDLHTRAVQDDESETLVQVEGNGQGIPRLDLILTNEGDAEFVGPVVDYRED